MDIVEELRIMAPYYPVQGKAADEIERLREALRFYSSFADAPPQANISPLMFDRGNKARTALKEGQLCVVGDRK
jgi:hypothetical protein